MAVWEICKIFRVEIIPTNIATFAERHKAVPSDVHIAIVVE